MKIAKYTIGGSTHAMIWESDEWREGNPGYVRMSEIVDVEFPPLPHTVVIPKQLAALDEQERELTAKHLEQLGMIQSRRKDLLALAPPELVTSDKQEHDRTAGAIT